MGFQWDPKKKQYVNVPDTPEEKARAGQRLKSGQNLRRPNFETGTWLGTAEGATTWAPEPDPYPGPKAKPASGASWNYDYKYEPGKAPWEQPADPNIKWDPNSGAWVNTSTQNTNNQNTNIPTSGRWPVDSNQNQYSGSQQRTSLEQELDMQAQQRQVAQRQAMVAGMTTPAYGAGMIDPNYTPEAHQGRAADLTYANTAYGTLAGPGAAAPPLWPEPVGPLTEATGQTFSSMLPGQTNFPAIPPQGDPRWSSGPTSFSNVATDNQPVAPPAIPPQRNYRFGRLNRSSPGLINFINSDPSSNGTPMSSKLMSPLKDGASLRTLSIPTNISRNAGNQVGGGIQSWSSGIPNTVNQNAFPAMNEIIKNPNLISRIQPDAINRISGSNTKYPPYYSPAQAVYRGRNEITRDYLTPGFKNAALLSSSAYNPSQSQMLDELYGATQGTKPSVAQLQAQQSADLAGRQGLALLAGRAGSNAGGSLYNALQSQTAAGLAGGAQAAQLRAQEMAQARQLYSASLGQAQQEEVARREQAVGLQKYLTDLGARQPVLEQQSLLAAGLMGNEVANAERNRQIQREQNEVNLAIGNRQNTLGLIGAGLQGVGLVGSNLWRYFSGSPTAPTTTQDPTEYRL